MASKAFRLGPVALSNILTTNILNPPTSTGGTGFGTVQSRIVLRHITVVNKTTAAATFSLWLGATGANAAGTEVIGQAQVVPANSSYHWYGKMVLNTADFLVGGASAATTLTIEGEGEIAPAAELFRVGPATLPGTVTDAINPPTATGGVNGGSSAYFAIIKRIFVGPAGNTVTAAGQISVWLGATGGSANGTEIVRDFVFWPTPPGVTGPVLVFSGELRVTSTEFVTVFSRGSVPATYFIEGELGIER